MVYTPILAQTAWVFQGLPRSDLGEKQGAIADYSQALSINPKNAEAYNNRGIAKDELGNKEGACMDYKKAIAQGSQSTAQWLQTEAGAWCRDMP